MYASHEEAAGRCDVHGVSSIRGHQFKHNVFEKTVGRSVLEKAFVNSVKAIEARNGTAKQ